MDLCRNQLEILNFLMLSLNKTCPNFLNFSPKLKSRHFHRNKKWFLSYRQSLHAGLFPYF